MLSQNFWFSWIECPNTLFDAEDVARCGECDDSYRWSVLFVLVFFVVWGLVHSLVRILQYGALSGAVRHSSVASYRKIVHDKGWGDMIPHGKASMFVEEHLRQTWWLRWLISNKRMPFVI